MIEFDSPTENGARIRIVGVGGGVMELELESNFTSARDTIEILGLLFGGRATWQPMRSSFSSISIQLQPSGFVQTGL